MTSRRFPVPRRRARAAVAALLLGGTVLSGAAIGLTDGSQAAAPQATAGALPGSFAGLVERVSPAVVNISTTRTAESQRMPRAPLPQFPPGSPFEEFFRHFQQPMQGGGMPPREVTALGSGFIIDAEGYIVTNNHVVEQADDIRVTLHDGSQVEAELVGRDPKTDLALIKIDVEEKLPHLEFGDSDSLRVGDWVVAVGNPFGLGGTVTAGIVSARGRDINAGPYDDFIQTDAAINRGNSGGPTFDAEGRVVGINTAIFSPSGGSVGIGFAIPSNLARPILAELKETGSVSRGWLGVQIQEVTPEIADSLGLDAAGGALVAAVQP
ncbi:MAG TPA: trypsin-like peptidase domain-containing protein, partial [Alphaproteobacteria bacterium]|nr:trypsin-like peptidase domain-containing protein [Alphaproteobacteria bacterium]